MKFTFKSKEHGFGSPEVTMEFEVDQIEDVVMYFEQFLRACDYRFDGKLDFVYDDESPVGIDDSDMSFSLGDIDINNTVFTWTVDNLNKDPVYIVNPVTTNVEKEGKHIHLEINEEVTTLMNRVCPVCKLNSKDMQNHKCYDANCGLKL